MLNSYGAPIGCRGNHDHHGRMEAKSLDGGAGEGVQPDRFSFTRFFNEAGTILFRQLVDGGEGLNMSLSGGDARLNETTNDTDGDTNRCRSKAQRSLFWVTSCKGVTHGGCGSVTAGPTREQDDAQRVWGIKQRLQHQQDHCHPQCYL